MTRPLTFRLAAIVALAAAGFLAGCGGGSDRAERAASPTATAGKSSTPAERSLTDLASVEDFAMRFNEKEGMPRLVLLLSPT